MFWVSATKLSETILSGNEKNHPGAYIPTPREAIENRKKYKASKNFLFFLKLLLWTIKKVMIATIDNITMILTIIHEKSHREGLINWFISSIDILLWKKYIVKISSTNSKNIPEIMIVFIIFIKVFFTKLVIATKPSNIRQTRKSLTKYHR